MVECVLSSIHGAGVCGKVTGSLTPEEPIANRSLLAWPCDVTGGPDGAWYISGCNDGAKLRLYQGKLKLMAFATRDAYLPQYAGMTEGGYTVFRTNVTAACSPITLYKNILYFTSSDQHSSLVAVDIATGEGRILHLPVEGCFILANWVCIWGLAFYDDDLY